MAYSSNFWNHRRKRRMTKAAADVSWRRNTKTTTATIPQLLTIEVARDLGKYLDAGDTLECYLLTRKTYLHHAFSTTTAAAASPQPPLPQPPAENSANNNAGATAGNGSHHSFTRRTQSAAATTTTTTEAIEEPESHKGMIPIQTTALGLRYRPPRSGGSAGAAKPPLSLTLEYGPNRAGRDNWHLSVPSLVPADDANNDPSGSTSTTSSANSMRVQWGNEAQVYYTTNDLSSSTVTSGGYYTTANFMASLTGAVLEDLLITASSYPTHHRRYQPWQVVLSDDASSGATASGTNNNNNNNNNKDYSASASPRLLLKSSGDMDFVYYLLEHLASVGVELSPVLNPTVYRLQLTATSLQRKALNPQDMKEMATFYSKLYSCLESIATATTTVPTTTRTSTTTTTSLPSAAPTLSSSTNTNQDGKNPTASSPVDIGPPHGRHNDVRRPRPRRASDRADRLLSDNNYNKNNNNDDDDHHDGDLTYQPPSIAPVVDKPKEQEHQDTSDMDSSPADSTTLETPDDNNNENNTTAPSAAPSPFPTTPSPTVASSSAPTAPTPAPISAADAAAEAAAEAKQAADAAAQDATNQQADPKQVAQAAAQAANAAQKAATATAQQQAVLRQEALFAGDVSAMSLCFSDPIYGFAPDPKLLDPNRTTTSGPTTTTVYLYWDSTYFFTAQVTAPYIRVVPHLAQLPKVSSKHGHFGAIHNMDNGLFVDGMLATVLIAFSLFACLVTLQQVLGRKCRILPKTWYTYQQWFFDPTRHYHLHGSDWGTTGTDNSNSSAQDDADIVDHKDEVMGDGHAYSAGQDSIPHSMGGIRSMGTNNSTSSKRRKRNKSNTPGRLPHDTLYKDQKEPNMANNDPLTAAVAARQYYSNRHPEFTIDGDDDDDDDDDDGQETFNDHDDDSGMIGVVGNDDNDVYGESDYLGDVELSKMTARSSSSSKNKKPTNIVGGECGVESLDVLSVTSGGGGGGSYYNKDPEFVDLPHLKTSTKVAMPVSLTLRRKNSNHNCSSLSKHLSSSHTG